MISPISVSVGSFWVLAGGIVCPEGDHVVVLDPGFLQEVIYGTPPTDFSVLVAPGCDPVESALGLLCA